MKSNPGRGSPAVNRLVTIIDGDVSCEIAIPLYSDSPDYPKSIVVSPETLAVMPYAPKAPIFSYHLITEDDGTLYVLEVPESEYIPNIPTVISADEARKYGVIIPGDVGRRDVQTLCPASDIGKETEIYQPSPIDKSEFAVAVSQNNSDRLGVDIYQEVKRKLPVKVYNEDFYIFNAREGIYEKVTDADFDRIINQFYGEKIAGHNNLRAYSDIREYLRKDYRLVIKEESLPPLNYWVFHNGIVDIVTGEVIENKGQYFITSALQGDYVPGATCPRFDEYIRAVSGGDDAVAARIREMTAYLLSRDTNGKVFFEIVGKKDTGKSLYGRLLAGLLGESSVSYLNADDFSNQFALAELNGKQLNLCMDLPDTPLSASTVGHIKAITGQDMIHSDVKYKQPVCFKPPTRLVFGSNYKIRTTVHDPAFNERKITIPFNYQVPKSKQIFGLDEQLISEASGIFNEMIPYYLDLVKRRYHFTEIDWSENDEITIDQDKVIESMASESLCFTGCSTDRISSDQLYQIYTDFCMSKTIEPLPLTKFSEKFRKVFPDQVTKKKIRIGDGSVWGFTGVKVNEKL